MRGAAIYAGCVAAALVIFLLLPQVDLWFSGLFFVPGRGFALRGWAPLVVVYRLVPWLAWSVVVIVALGAAWLFLTQRPFWRLDRKALLFIALSTAIGPGLLTNTVLKDHWGRARPEQITAFGGPLRFTPAPLPAAQCRRNCSFVSGHAALAFSLVAFAFLLPSGKTRRRGIAAALGVGTAVGAVRIAQGGHFLSDVVWAGLLAYGTAALLYWWIVEKDGLAAPALVRLYRALGRGVRCGVALLRTSEAARSGAGVLSAALLVLVSIAFVDRPVAVYFHTKGPDFHALFSLTARLGVAWGWSVLFALGFVALHWGGELPRLRGAARRMRVLSSLPAFLLLAILSAGAAVDLLKIALGRTRPKLLFNIDLYSFTGLSWRPDHWSFPSGHTATIVALAAALWWLWPRHLLFYGLAAAIVAGSRIAAGAHYPSDVIAGALIGVLAARWVAAGFEHSGIDLAAAARGGSDFSGLPPWPCRRFLRNSGAPPGSADSRAGRSLAPAAEGVVSAWHHGAADRDV